MTGRGRPKTGKLIVSVIHLRGTRAWKEWYGRLRQHARLSGPALIERALLDWARKTGFKEEPPER